MGLGRPKSVDVFKRNLTTYLSESLPPEVRLSVNLQGVRPASGSQKKGKVGPRSGVGPHYCRQLGLDPKRALILILVIQFIYYCL